MIEFDTFEYFRRPGLIIEISSERKSLGLRSKRELLRTNSQAELRQRFRYEPTRSSENAPSVDLMQLFEQFSNQEKELILDNFTGLQLTQGCNGECSYCMFGVKRGVDAKFSFESVEKFIMKYWKSIKQNHPALYWDSDPLDYADRGKDITDVYRLIRQKDRISHVFISTSLPIGSEDRAARFILELAEEYHRLPSGFSDRSKLRFSIAKHNIQRIEDFMISVQEKLLSKGYSLDEIDSFMQSAFLLNILTGDNAPEKLGPLIKMKDPVGEIKSPACADGVIISPKGVDAIMMVTPTIYDPSGQRNIKLTPNKCLEYIPTRSYIFEHSISHFPDLSHPVNPNVFRGLTSVKRGEGEYLYRIPGSPTENITFRLSRNILAAVLFLQDFSVLSNPHISDDIKYTYVRNLFVYSGGLTLTLGTMIKCISANIQKGKLVDVNHVDTNIMGYSGSNRPFMPTSEEFDKLQYYLNLAKIYLKLLDIVEDEYDRRGNMHDAIAAASRLSKIKEADIKKLPQFYDESYSFR